MRTRDLSSIDNDGGGKRLRGLRLVLLTDDATVVGVEEMAKGQKLWVGQKR